MGLLDLIRPKKEDVRATRSALEAAEDGTADDGAINGLVTKILNFGLDGAGPLDSAVQIAEEARSKHKSTNDAIDAVVRKHLIGGRGRWFRHWCRRLRDDAGRDPGQRVGVLCPGHPDGRRDRAPARL
jgi:hypothetical protein